MSNRQFVVFGILILGLLLHIEYRTSGINDRIERLEQTVVQTKFAVRYTDKDVDCLARNIYYEAGIEADIGKYAVAHVTVNRVRTGYWGKSVCQVVYAPAQFSWTLQKRLPKPDPALYQRCHAIAQTVLQGYGVSGLEHSLFYHADYIAKPSWADTGNRITQIGRHIFYTRGKGSTLEI